MKYRVVLDTNVLVSGLLGGVTTEVLREYRNGAFELVISRPIFAEYEAVLRRPKFKLPLWVIDEVLKFIGSHAVWVESTDSSQPSSRDISDNKFLQAAITGHADWLVSGDQDLLDIEPIPEVEIVSPGEFLLYLQTGR